MLLDHAAAATADFQQYYGLDLGSLIDVGEWRRADLLAAGLPAKSRTMRAIDARLSCGDEEYLLAAIIDNLSYLRYESAVSSGAKRAKKPKPLKRPGGGKPARVRERTVHGMSAERVGEILARPRP